MDINWWTFGAQIVNFLILMGLLWYFLFRPIIRAVDRREEEIAHRIDEAENRKEQAEEERQKLERERQELRDHKEEYLAEAKDEAEKKRKELVARAREDVEEARQHWRNSLDREKDSFLQDLRRRASHQVFEAVRKALRDLADAEVEERMVGRFIDRIDQLDEDRQQEIRDAIAQEDADFVVRSAFEIPSEQQKTIREKLLNLLDEERRVDFETSDNLIAGVEAQAGGQKVAWTVTDYHEGLEQQVEAAINTQTQRGQHAKNAKLPRVKTSQSSHEEEPAPEHEEAAAESSNN